MLAWCANRCGCSQGRPAQGAHPRSRRAIQQRAHDAPEVTVAEDTGAGDGADAGGVTLEAGGVPLDDLPDERLVLTEVFGLVARR
jgi:hypothetical protein